MKKIAIFGTSFLEKYDEYFIRLIDKIRKENCDMIIYEEFYESVKDKYDFGEVKTFTENKEIKDNIDFLFSIGGDGTMLKTLCLICDSNIPVIGINLGRLGFLSTVGKEDVERAVDAMLSGNYKLEKRSLIQVNDDKNSFGNKNFGLNEVSFHKQDSSSIIIVNVWVDGIFLNSYIGDGIIISTPTGSTAYSLSCGGPILTPDSDNFIITPVANHNLTVRPLVIPDSCELKMVIEGRSKEFLLSMDSKTWLKKHGEQIYVKKNDFSINIVRLSDKSFFSAIRDKMLWGNDLRK